jgi:hypothetical protein
MTICLHHHYKHILWTKNPQTHSHQIILLVVVQLLRPACVTVTTMEHPTKVYHHHPQQCRRDVMVVAIQQPRHNRVKKHHYNNNMPCLLSILLVRPKDWTSKSSPLTKQIVVPIVVGPRSLKYHKMTVHFIMYGLKMTTYELIWKSTISCQRMISCQRTRWSAGTNVTLHHIKLTGFFLHCSPWKRF